MHESRGAERYKQASTGVTELTKQLTECAERLETLKAQVCARRRACPASPPQTDERGSSITNAEPVVKIKQALNKLKADISQMELRIGVVRRRACISAITRAAEPHAADGQGADQKQHDPGHARRRRQLVLSPAVSTFLIAAQNMAEHDFSQYEIPALIAFDLDDTLWYPEMYMVGSVRIPMPGLGQMHLMPVRNNSLPTGPFI